MRPVPSWLYSPSSTLRHSFIRVPPSARSHHHSPSKPGSDTPTSHPTRHPFSSMQSPISRPLASLRPSQSPWKLTNNKGVWTVKCSLFSALVTSFLSQSPSFPELLSSPTRWERGAAFTGANAEGLHPRYQINTICYLTQHIYTLSILMLKKEMATHSSILAWRITWTEETGEQPSMGHDLATL